MNFLHAKKYQVLPLFVTLLIFGIFFLQPLIAGNAFAVEGSNVINVFNTLNDCLVAADEMNSAYPDWSTLHCEEYFTGSSSVWFLVR